MKKYLVVLVAVMLVMPLAARAALVGFLDGNMYDPVSGTWRCMYLGDGNCYDLNQNILTTRPVGFTQPTVLANLPDLTTPQTTATETPINVGGNQVVNAPTCTLSESNFVSPTTTNTTTLTWQTNNVNVSTNTPGTIYGFTNSNHVPYSIFGYVYTATGTRDSLWSGATPYKITFANGTSCTAN